MSLEKVGTSPFLEVFGTSPINKVLDFLTVFNDFDYSMATIAHKSGVGYATLKLLLPQLKKKNIITQTRISGKSPMYKLNTTNPLVKKFVAFYWSLDSPQGDSKQKQRIKSELL